MAHGCQDKAIEVKTFHPISDDASERFSRFEMDNDRMQSAQQIAIMISSLFKNIAAQTYT